MSETFDGNTGWQVDDNGDVVPPQESHGLLPDKAIQNINQRNITEDPEYQQSAPDSEMNDDFDPVAGITQEQARQLNQDAQRKRNGRPVDPNSLN